ncbi:MAG: hypothetical protein GX112_13610 [Clostridiaceae bacterium]|jgi:CarD family transcriptional regulator|nr:hypothetical protein [Clostridiaceae bacterium]
MYQVDDCVVFGTTGVCLISEIIHEDFGDAEKRAYYVLTPVNGKGPTIYVPTDNCAGKFRRLMSLEDALALLNQLPDLVCNWPADDTERRELFSNLLQSGEPLNVARVVGMLTLHQEQLAEDSKRLSAQDSDLLKTAEQTLYPELAYVLGTDEEQAAKMVLERIQGISVS